MSLTLFRADWDVISRRAFGPQYPRHCLDPKEVCCRRYVCQSANRCQLVTKRLAEQIKDAHEKGKTRLAKRKMKRLAKSLIRK